LDEFLKNIVSIVLLLSITRGKKKSEEFVDLLVRKFINQNEFRHFLKSEFAKWFIWKSLLWIRQMLFIKKHKF